MADEVIDYTPPPPDPNVVGGTPPPPEDNLFQAGQRVEHWAYNVWDYLKLSNNTVDEQVLKHLEALEAAVASFADKVRAAAPKEMK